MNKLMYIRSKFYLDIDPMENNIDSFSCQNKFECRIQEFVLLNLEKMLELKVSSWTNICHIVSRCL